MSTYDQLAFSNRPFLYLAAPLLVDQSGSTAVTISSNNLALGGQPIIYGHPSSFKVTETANLVLDGAPLFSPGTTTEFVIYSERPAEERGVFVSDNDHGLFITPTGVLLRLRTKLGDIDLGVAVDVKVAEWSKKIYVRLTMGDHQALLTINELTEILNFDGTLDDSAAVTETQMLGSQYLLLDGLGLYRQNIESKAEYIDDPGSNHALFAATIYSGKTTLFDSYFSLGKSEITLAEFYFDPGDQSYQYNYPVVYSEDPNMYLVVKTNDDSVTVHYDVNGMNLSSFTKQLIVELSSFGVSLNMKVEYPSEDFRLTVETIQSADIELNTPAVLLTTGTPVFPDNFSESVVNCPEGISMRDVSYSGEWVEFEGHDGIPNSIEMVFKPKNSADSNVYFSNSDTYTMYLNNVEVTDLSSVRWNEWNHLVLVASSPTDQDFVLNDGSDVDYLFLTAYYNELTEDQIEMLYSIVLGIDAISVSDTPVEIAEGQLDSGQPFEVFGVAWSIVGAGGN